QAGEEQLDGGLVAPADAGGHLVRAGTETGPAVEVGDGTGQPVRHDSSVGGNCDGTVRRRPANRQGAVWARRSVRAEPATGGVVVRDGGGTPGVGRGPGPFPAETEGTACSGVLEQRGSGAGRAGTCSWPGPPSGPGREMSPAVTSTLRFWLLRATRNTVPQNGLRRRGRPGTTLGNDRLGRPSRL